MHSMLNYTARAMHHGLIHQQPSRVVVVSSRLAPLNTTRSFRLARAQPPTSASDSPTSSSTSSPPTSAPPQQQHHAPAFTLLDSHLTLSHLLVCPPPTHIDFLACPTPSEEMVAADRLPLDPLDCYRDTAVLRNKITKVEKVEIVYGPEEGEEEKSGEDGEGSTAKEEATGGKEKQEDVG